MNKLTIDFQSLLPYVIDAFSHVYGEEYRTMISSKINNAIIIYYHDLEGLDDYVSYLKRCKARELSIRFLDEIGVDVQQYKKSNYIEPLDSNIQEVLENYISYPHFGFSKIADHWAPLRAFHENNKENPKILLKNKIKIINYLLGSEHEQITEENFNAFALTKEYLEILEQIKQLNVVYERLLSEYHDWEKELLPCEEYVEYETKRKEDILQKKKDEMFEIIFSYLPVSVREILTSKTIKEQQDTIFGYKDISSTVMIEYFSQEKMEKLQSKDVKLNEKYLIVLWQTDYLRKLGISIPNEEVLKCNSEEDVKHYLSFLNQNDIQKYIPSQELVHYISSIRTKKYEEALREYYTTRADFVNIMKIFVNNSRNFEIIYDNIKKKRVRVIGPSATNVVDNSFIPIMFYTIRCYDSGVLFQNFMHESGHVIDKNQFGCGFETYSTLLEDEEKNPYDSSFRIYEKFNETLNDLFTMEAVQYLQNKGIYLIEPKEFTALDTSNVNTALITKNLFKPLLQRFRKQVIKAKVNSNPDELVKYIGEANFKNLVDAVNKVDYLSKKGVAKKVDKFKDDPMVLEYFEQVERVKQIYMDIDDYYANHFEDLEKDSYENSAIKR